MRPISFMFVMVLVASIIVACEGRDDYKARKNGLELIASLDKSQYDIDEKLVSRITILNHGGVEQQITVPVTGQGIAHVWTHSEYGHGILQAGAIEKKVFKEAVLDNVSVYTIGPGETLEQDFVWEQRLFDPLNPFGENNELLAPSGDYKLYSVIMLGEMRLEQGESIDDMMARYEKSPLEQLSVSLDYKIAGDRKLISVEEAIAIALSNPQAKQWFESRTYKQLVKKENGAWVLKDIDGQWTQIEKRLLEQLKHIEPRLLGGERQEETMLLHYESGFGGSPNRMTVTIHVDHKKVTSVDFMD